MENVLFKVAFPAEFHAQTAVECAMRLHPLVRGRIDEIERIEIETQEAGVRIIDKTGPLHNPADRDHCIQYMVAVPLIHGELTDRHYEDDVAADPRIDALRAAMRRQRGCRATRRDYLDPAKRSIANAVRVVFGDGTRTERVEVEYPLGHPRRRAEARPLLRDEAARESRSGVRRARARRLVELLLDDPALPDLSASAVMRARCA